MKFKFYLRAFLVALVYGLIGFLITLSMESFLLFLLILYMELSKPVLQD